MVQTLSEKVDFGVYIYFVEGFLSSDFNRMCPCSLNHL